MVEVALVSPYPAPGHAADSGVAAYARDLARALSAAGAGVTVIAPRTGGPTEATDDGVRILRCFSPGPGAPVSAARAALRHGPEIVHYQHEHFLYGRAAAPAAVPALRTLSRRVPTVVTLHQVVPPAAVDGGFVRLHQMALPPRAARIALSGLQNAVAAAARRVVVHEPAFARVVPGAVVIPHGVRVAGRRSQEAARIRVGLGDAFVVLCFGYVAPYKGLEAVLEGARRAGDTQVVVAGGVHPRLRDGAAYLEGLRRAYPDVAQFTGYVPEGEVDAWFAAADVAAFCYPRPHASSGGLSLALAHGTPVVVSAALGALSGLPGVTVVDVDPDAIAARLARLRDRPEERAALAAVSRSIARGRSWDEVARAHLGVYEEVMG